MTSNERWTIVAARRRALTAFMLGAPLLGAGCASRGNTQEEPEPPIEFPVEWFSDSRDVDPAATLPEIRSRLLAFGDSRVRQKLELASDRGPFAVAVRDSETLTEMVSRDLVNRGVAVAAKGEPGAATLRFDVEIAFQGRFGVLPPVSFGKLYEAACIEGMQKATHAWVNANAFGGQPGLAATRVAIGEVAGRLLGLDAPLRVASAVGDIMGGSGRRARANYLAYGDAREKCIAACSRRPWFWHSTGCSATVKTKESEKTALVWVNPGAARVEPSAAFELAYGLLVRDGLGIGTERWRDQLKDED
ncbi:MAG TPA: hypothetical protein VNK91_14845 [Burkholderiaceae bacterium]|nr:hypothetical protein [Burkholderiaceae bacterium]